MRHHNSDREAAIEMSQTGDNPTNRRKVQRSTVKNAERNGNMAKIDVTTIEGFADMTPEQKLEALQGYDFPDPDYSGYVKKDLYDKAASNAAEWKRKHNALLSDEQQKQQEQADSLAAMQQELEALRKEKTVSEYKARYLSLGFEDKLAQETAKAMADGDMGKVFANTAKANEALVKRTIAERLKGTPRGVGDGAGGSVMTLDRLRKLPDDEYAQFASEHPEEYKALYEKGEG